MKKRLDVLLVERGVVETRTQAQALIMAGQVSANGRRLEKPGTAIDESIDLHVKDQPRYVSRAGDKLASVSEELALQFKGRMLIDVGSSTGGFTDFALQQGAVKVYCVDVGTGQLSYKLRNDARVAVMEKTDIRDAKIPERVDMAVIDVSFISLKQVLEPTAAIVRDGGQIVAMAKPQFEVGKPVADRYRGVIPMGEERDEALDDLRSWFKEHHFEIEGEADSGVHGAEGNVEHFFVLHKEG